MEAQEAAMHEELEPEPKRSRTVSADEQLREQLGLRIRGDGCPRPVRNFSELELPDSVADALARRGLVLPTPIQAQAWPPALAGRDVVGIAQTGSGKTLAYVVPAVVRILAQPIISANATAKGPVVLALAPTRELAAQIADEVVRLEPTMSVCCVQGGVSRGEQVLQLRLGAEFVVATPGRLADLVNRGKICLAERTELLILDEADRLLEMGFEVQLRIIVGACRRQRQTLMWSATWSKAISALAADLLSNPLHIEARTPPSAALLAIKSAAFEALGEGAARLAGGSQHAANAAPSTIAQRLIAVANNEGKLKALVRLLEDTLDDTEAVDVQAAEAADAQPGGGRVSRVLVFVNSKKRTDELTRELRADGWPALGLHGDKCQLEREWALGEFKTGRAPVLVATDVAQRGLDIPNVGAVVNFDMPPTIDA